MLIRTEESGQVSPSSKYGMVLCALVRTAEAFQKLWSKENVATTILMISILNSIQICKILQESQKPNDFFLSMIIKSY